jgi:hypothetical protein
MSDGRSWRPGIEGLVQAVTVAVVVGAVGWVSLSGVVMAW